MWHIFLCLLMLYSGSAPSILRMCHILAPMHGAKGCSAQLLGLRQRYTGMNSGLQPSLCGVKGSRGAAWGLDSRPREAPTRPPRLYSHRVAFCFLWSL